MARAATSKDVPRKRGAKDKYPWEEWLKIRKRGLVITKGKDFQTSLNSMGIMIRRKARKLSLKVSVLKHEDGKSLILKLAQKPTEKSKAE
jgi:hypothetical protein